jgi:hypothetical protein
MRVSCPEGIVRIATKVWPSLVRAELDLSGKFQQHAPPKARCNPEKRKRKKNGAINGSRRQQKRKWTRKCPAKVGLF